MSTNNVLGTYSRIIDFSTFIIDCEHNFKQSLNKMRLLEFYQKYTFQYFNKFITKSKPMEKTYKQKKYLSKIKHILMKFNVFTIGYYFNVDSTFA